MRSSKHTVEVEALQGEKKERGFILRKEEKIEDTLRRKLN